MALTSRDNRTVKLWRRLAADAHFRRSQGLFALEGARLCGDAAWSGVKLETVLYTARAAETYPRQLETLLSCGADCQEISEDISRYMGETASPQGIFCVARALDNRLTMDTIKRMGTYIALEDIQDPTNLGTIVRTAEALGVDGMILSSGCCDLYNPKVLRGSMGGVFRLPFLIADRMEAAVDAMQRQGMTVWACVLDPAATPVHRAPLGPGSVCLIGNEGNGLRPETIAACRERLTIRMAGRAESLNASMAAGIVLWELTRPREA